MYFYGTPEVLEDNIFSSPVHTRQQKIYILCGQDKKIKIIFQDFVGCGCILD